VRQTLTESLLVATVGGAGGLLLALWAVPALVAMAPREVPRLDEIGIDWSTFAFAAAVSVAVGILCGIAACLPFDARKARVVLSQVRSTAAPPSSRFRRGLTVVEVALTLMLVIAAALMVRTMRQLGALDLGFDPASVVAADLPMDRAMLSSGNIAGLRQREATIVEQVRALPGVKAAGIGLGPLRGSMGLGGLIVPGDTRDFGILGVDSVSVGYFEALGARLTAGRFFDDTDAINPQTVVVVNEAAARLLWPGDNPIGKDLINYKERLSVIGVVANMRAVPLEDEPRPRLFLLHLRDRNFFANTMLVRTNGDPESLVPAIRTILKSFDGEHPFRGVEPLQDRIDRAMAPRIFILRVVGLFSLIGMLLAVVGIYGVVAESVAQRVPEIGVRMALGARASDVRQLILRQGVGLVAVGITFGLIGAYFLRGVMTTMVFGVQTLDPIAYVVACVVLGVTTLAACAIPAGRAARLDPVAALRIG
jgi:predicted permease